MPLTGFCKWVFLIFPPMHSAPNPPMSQSYSFSLCSFGLFPSLCFISTLPLPLFLPLLLHVSLVYLCSPLIGLRQAHFFPDPWYPVLDAAFPQEWTNLMINALSLFLRHADTLTPNWHRAQKLAQRLPTNYHTASTTLPPVSIPQTPTNIGGGPPMCLCVCIYSCPSSITFRT